MSEMNVNTARIIGRAVEQHSFLYDRHEMVQAERALANASAATADQREIDSHLAYLLNQAVLRRDAAANGKV